MSTPDSLTILVVDDTRVNVSILTKGLAREGYQVISANNGPTAREMALEHKPDLILLDIVMPGENGFETIKKLKSNSAVAAIPVIFITGDDTVSSKVEGFDLGAVDYITKPFHMDEVRARVRLHMRLSIATNALIQSQANKLQQLQDAQTSMLTQPEDLPDARFSAFYSALHEAGGDFYEVFTAAENIHGYFLADVSGHDIATSFITASVKALLKQNCKPIYHPVESMRMINSVLVETLPSGKYLTACYVLLNRRAMNMTFVNMAHPPVLFTPKGGKTELLELDGDILGAFPESAYRSKLLKVQPGDRFVMYSDGLVERAESGQIWTEEILHLPAWCDELRDVPIEQVADRLNQRAGKQQGEPDDDVVIVAVEV